MALKAVDNPDLVRNMNMIFFPPFLVLMLPAYFVTRSYDRLIQFEYEYYRPEWENDGKNPLDMFGCHLK